MKTRLLRHYLVAACLFMSCSCFFCNKPEVTTYEEYGSYYLPYYKSSIDIPVNGFVHIFGQDVSYDDFENPTYCYASGLSYTASWVKTNPNILSVTVDENWRDKTNFIIFRILLNKSEFPKEIRIYQERKP